jgi:hypothetical protein
MKRTEWQKRVSRGDMLRRAFGRTRHNLRRQLYAELRMLEVIEMLRERGAGRGELTRIAHEIGVNRSTVSRWVAAAREKGIDMLSWFDLVNGIKSAQRRIKRFWEVELARRERNDGRSEWPSDPDYPFGPARGADSAAVNFQQANPADRATADHAPPVDPGSLSVYQRMGCLGHRLTMFDNPPDEDQW